MVLEPKLASVNGTQLEYVETGEGSPIIFIHGHLSDYRTWVELFGLFSNNFRHVAYTQRYFEPNLANADSIQINVDEHIEDLCQFIEAINCAPASLIGMSYGAGIALRAAAMRPDLIKSMVLYEPGTDDHILDAPGYDAVLTQLREKIKTPTLMVGGELSLPFYAMGSDALAKYLPNGFGVKMKDVGHGGIALKPEEFVKKAESFLKLTAE